MSEAAPIFITVAPNGARRTKADHPLLPTTADEIARCAADCARAGAAMIHLHVRDEARRHSLDADLYKRAIDATRRAAGDDLIIQITTEAAGAYQPPAQMQTVREVRPEAASLALRELCPAPAGEAAYADFLAECADMGVWTQHILYSPDEVRRFADLRARGVIPETTSNALAVIGAYRGGPPSAPALVDAFADAAREAGDCLWSVCAFGRSELSVLLHAAALGWSVRTGFENNLEAPDGTPARDNADLVGILAAALEDRRTPLLPAAEVRRRHARRP